MPTRAGRSWQELYEQQPVETMPWYLDGLDPDLAQALTARGFTSGRALDLGTGPGTQAMSLAARGFDVTGADIAASAVKVAAATAKKRGLSVRFVADDVCRSKLTGPFDFAFDRGCFHVLEPADRPRYVEGVQRLLKPRAVLFLKCFSDEQPGTTGPHRLSPGEVRSVFAGSFDVVSVERTEFQGTLPVQPKALFCVLVRR